MRNDVSVVLVALNAPPSYRHEKLHSNRRGQLSSLKVVYMFSDEGQDAGGMESCR